MRNDIEVFSLQLLKNSEAHRLWWPLRAEVSYLFRQQFRGIADRLRRSADEQEGEGQGDEDESEKLRLTHN